MMIFYLLNEEDKKKSVFIEFFDKFRAQHQRWLRVFRRDEVIILGGVDAGVLRSNCVFYAGGDVFRRI